MDSTSVVKQDLSYIIASLGQELELLSGKRMLITGGAGFLGYYLIQTIVRWNEERVGSGQTVIDLLVFDNFARGVPDWMKELDHTIHLTIREHDVSKPLPSDLGDVDYAIHAASIASPIFYRQFPIETMDANVNGLRFLLDYFAERAAKGVTVGGLLYFSTSEIYGDPTKENIPTPETYRGNVSCTGPRACYDESKRYGETLCVNFAKQFDIPIKIARPFKNYGPGWKLSDGRALPDFCSNVLRDEDINLFSDGSPTRTFCYVADAIIGYLKILTLGRSGEAYNIGTASPEVSMRDLAGMVVELGSELFGYSGAVVFSESHDVEYLTDNPNRRAPQIEKAKKELSYYPSISLEEGLRRSLVWYSGNLEGY